MDKLISEQKVLKIIDNLKANFTCYDSVTLDEVASHVKAIPSAYKGMTNGEVLKAVFPNIDFCGNEFHGLMLVDMEDIASFELDWWNSPYEPQESEK